MAGSEAISGMNPTVRTADVAMSSSKSKASDKLDFGSIMSQSLATKANSKDSSIYTNVADNASGKNVNSVQKEKPKADYASDKVTDKKEINLDGQDKDKVKSMLDDIRQKIKETFGLSDEEFEAAMESLGFVMQDLLKTGNLTELVATVTESDGALSLLTDGVLSGQLKDVMNFINSRVKQLAEEMDMTPQELTSYVLDTAQADTFANAVQTAEGDISKTPEKAADLPVKDEETVMNNAGADNLQRVSSLEKKITLQTGQESQSQSSEMNQKNTPESEHSDPIASIATNLTQSINESFGETMIQNTQQVNAADIVQQIIDSVRVVSTESLQSMEIQLNPENLGKLHLTVTSRDGVMMAQFTAQDEAVKKAIESQISILKENLNNQGLKVESVEVTVESHAFEQNQNSDKSSGQNADAGSNRRRHLNLDSLMGLNEDELSQDEQRVMDLFKSEGSSVSYTA